MKQSVAKNKTEESISSDLKNKSLFEARIKVRSCRVNEEESQRIECVDGV
jgi:hypothetical protein